MRTKTILLSLLAASVVFAGGSFAATPPATPLPCTPMLMKPEHGAQAIAKLGARLSAVARRNDQTTAAMQKLLRTDSTLFVDQCGRTFYVEPAPGERRGAAPSAAAPSGALPFLSEQTFRLHSRPGTNRVIYLDFDGAVLSGTVWNVVYSLPVGYLASAYDTDGSLSTFSEAERAVVQSVWQRVAEDYAPFDVDVTTEDPGDAAIDRSGSSDLAYGTRALITNDAAIQAQCWCGGQASVGSFDDYNNHQYYQPALAFATVMYGNPKYIADAVSHEVGHNLGLLHDGAPGSPYYSGQGSWAPIMGVGYYRPIVQWSNGDYANATNNQDDFLVMQSYGAPLRADDYPNARAGAVSLGTTPLNASGLIETRTDVDWFSFSGSGQTDVAVTPAPVSPNLDVRVELYDAVGTLVASADPPAATFTIDFAHGLGASISVLLPSAGTYYVKVDGVGFGNPLDTGYSDYASVGQYTVSVAAGVGVPANISLPTISGTAQAGAGQTLTAANGTWTNSPTSFAYQWRRCDSAGAGCADIAAATGQSYAPVMADVGATLRVSGTATNASGTGASATSAQTAPIAGLRPTPPPQPPAEPRPGPPPAPPVAPGTRKPPPGQS